MSLLDTTRAQLEAHLRRNLRSDSRPTALHLRALAFGHDAEALADVPPEAFEEPDLLAGELAAAAVERALDARRAMRFILEGDGPSFPILRFTVRPEAVEQSVPDHRALARPTSRDVTLAEDVEGPGAYIAEHRGEMVAHVPPLNSQAAALAAFSLRSMSEMQDLLTRSAAQREDGLMRENDRLREEVRHYAQAHTAVIFEREALLDRSHERKMKADRQKANDESLRQLAQKLFGLAVAHVPDLVSRLGATVNPEVQKLLVEVARSTALSPVAARVSQAIQSGVSDRSNGAPTMSADTTSSSSRGEPTITIDGRTVAGPAACIAFAGMCATLLTGVRDQLVMVRAALAPAAQSQLDSILSVLDAHGDRIREAAADALTGRSPLPDTHQGTPTAEDDAKITRLMELSWQFWASVRESDADAMHTFLPPKARDALDEIRRNYNFSGLGAPSAN